MSFNMNHVMFKVSQLVTTRGAGDSEEQREHRIDFAFKKLVEEVGEYSKAVNQPQRCEEPAESELADVLLCVMDLIHLYTNGDPHKWITQTLTQKLEKWGSQVLTPEYVERWNVDMPKHDAPKQSPTEAFGAQGRLKLTEVPVATEVQQQSMNEFTALLRSSETRFETVDRRVVFDVLTNPCTFHRKVWNIKDLYEYFNIERVFVDGSHISLNKEVKYPGYPSMKYMMTRINEAYRQKVSPKEEAATITKDTEFYYVGSTLYAFGRRLVISVSHRTMFNISTGKITFGDLVRLCGISRIFIDNLPLSVPQCKPDVDNTNFIAEHINNALNTVCNKQKPNKEITDLDICDFIEKDGEDDYRYVIKGNEAVSVIVKSPVSMPQKCTLRYLLEGYKILRFQTDTGFYIPLQGNTVEKVISEINKYFI